MDRKDIAGKCISELSTDAVMRLINEEVKKARRDVAEKIKKAIWIFSDTTARKVCINCDEIIEENDE